MSSAASGCPASDRSATRHGKRNLFIRLFLDFMVLFLKITTNISNKNTIFAKRYFWAYRAVGMRIIILSLNQFINFI